MTGAGCVTGPAPVPDAEADVLDEDKGEGAEERFADAPVVLAAPVRSDAPAVRGGRDSRGGVGMEPLEEEDDDDDDGDDEEGSDGRSRALARIRASSFMTP